MDFSGTRLGEPALIGVLRRYWRLFTTPPVPDYQPSTPAEPDPTLDPRLRRLRESERVLDLLERTRARVVEYGWTSGGWFSRPGATVGEAPRLVSHREAMALLRRPSGAGAACLIGSMLLLADDRDTAHTLEDVWRATDELYEAMHERAGRDSFAPGRRYGPRDRYAHLRALTGWNDAPGRSQGDVVDLLNRGISRTIAACVA